MTAAPGNDAVLVRIGGRVQGVGFRYWVVREAAGRGLSGWVRNRRDGTVEALFAGPRSAVEGMIEACRDGPAAAMVRTLTHEPAEPPREPGFAVRETV